MLKVGRLEVWRSGEKKVDEKVVRKKQRKKSMRFADRVPISQVFGHLYIMREITGWIFCGLA
jgi:hypothetical protein